MSDDLPREFAHALEGSRHRLGRLGSPVLFFSSIASTNDVASEIARSGDGEGTVVIADEQTAGRGRRGHTWFSPAGSGLYVSIVLTPARARVDRERATTILPLAAGVALAESVDAIAALRIDLKWPNDLLVARRKLGGILAEAVSTSWAPGREGRQSSGTVDAVVLGYGINVGPMAYPPELGDRATSLESELDRPVERAALWVETLAALSRRYGGSARRPLRCYSRRLAGTRAGQPWSTRHVEYGGRTAGRDHRGHRPPRRAARSRRRSR